MPAGAAQHVEPAAAHLPSLGLRWLLPETSLVPAEHESRLEHRAPEHQARYNQTAAAHLPSLRLR